MVRFLFTVVLLAAQTTAFASTSFWVSVGSFQDAAVAETVLNEAAAALNEHFVLQRVDTPSGVSQRVVTGPFESQDAARIVQQQATARGYSDSWVFAAEADATAPADPAGPEDISQPLVGGGVDTHYRGDNDSLDDPTVNQSPVSRPAIVEPELPTEIPPGYQLNSLYRDGAGTTPDS